MRLLVCSTDQNRSLKLLQATLSLSPDILTLDLFQSLESFFERLRQPIPSNTAVLIVTSDVKDLRKLVSMGEYLLSCRVIVVLPNDNPETLDLARHLWPRYIAFGDGDFSDVAAVLKKIADGQKKAGRQRKALLDIDKEWRKKAQAGQVTAGRMKRSDKTPGIARCIRADGKKSGSQSGFGTGKRVEQGVKFKRKIQGGQK